MSKPDDLELRLRATLEQHAGDVDPSSRPFDPGRGMLVDLDGVGSGLPRVPGRGRTRVRATVVAAAATVLVVVGVAVAVNRQQPDTATVQVASGSPASVGGTPSSIVGSMPSPQTVTVESLNGLFTATSAEFNGPAFANSWLNYSGYATRIGTNRCLEREGSAHRVDVGPAIPVTGASAPTIDDNTQFPDIERLKAGTFLTSAGSPSTDTAADPTPTGTTADDPARGDAVEQCEQQVTEPYRSVIDEVRTYVGLWGRRWVDGIDTDAAVVAAKADYVSCMAGRGITVTARGSDGDVTDVFGLADEATRQGDTARVAELAEAYGTCFEPVSEAMDSYRLARRAEFYRDNRAALQKLADDIDAAETRLSGQYGIPRP